MKQLLLSLLGTLLGAAVGSAMSSRRYNNTAAGAATGLMMGSVVGAGNSQAEGQSAQHRLRRKLRHARSIISFQRKIKPRHGNPFAIIHFFPAPALAMIAKTVLAKKNVNPITYKNITII